MKKWMTSLFLLGSLAHGSFAFSETTPSFAPPEMVFDETLKKTLEVEKANRLYNMIFPAYLEICAGSQWQKRGAAWGGNFGHGFAIIRGACRVEDPKTHIPQLKACKGGVVGISTDANYHNVQWTAVQSREMMLYGTLSPATALNRETYEKMLQAADQEGFLNGVRFRSDAKEVHDHQSALDYVTATDFGVAVARSVDCTRIPLTGTKPGKENGPLEDVITFLNRLNQQAQQTASNPADTGVPPYGFDYDSMVNNCAHTAYNALASIGLWAKKNTEGHPDEVTEQLRRKNDLVAPFNAVLDAYVSNSNFDVKRILLHLRTHPEAMRTFKEYGWLGTQAGVLIEDIPAHNYQNAIFDPTVHRDFFSLLSQGVWYFSDITKTKKVPAPHPMETKFAALVADTTGPAINLKANLLGWKAKYQAALLDPFLELDDSIANDLRAHIEAKLQEVEKALARIDDAEAALEKAPVVKFNL